MEKVNIELPESFAFITEIPITIHYINYGGHVSNSAYLDIAHEARLRYLAHLGMSELDFAGKSLIMGNAAIQFKKEVFHGETLVVKIGATHITKISFDLVYGCYKTEKNIADTHILVAVIKTGMICFDYSTKKVVSIPEKAFEQLSKKDISKS